MSEDAVLIAAEQAVLGAAVLGAAGELAAIVQPRYFMRPAHGLIFAAAGALADRGDPVDPVSVLLELERTGEFRAAGGGDYLHTCVAAAAADARWHARQVAWDYRRRGGAEALERAAQMLRSPGCEPGDFEAVRKLADDALTVPQETALPGMGQLVAGTVDALERRQERGLPTGISDLTDALGGLAGGTLVLAAARPGIGKSVLLLGIAAHVAIVLGLPVLLSSLEMSGQEMTLRLLASLGRVNLHSLTTRQLTEADWEKVARAAGRIGDAPLLIDDKPGASLGDFRARLREMDRTAPAALLCVDYIQLMSGPKAESRQAAVGEMARGLKNLARERGIPVLAACQLNRGPEQRTDRRPVLADLRESGELEQAADVVILLSREDAYNRESVRAGEIDLDIAKNRQGPQCTVTAAFQGHFSRVVDMAPAWTREVA